MNYISIHASRGGSDLWDSSLNGAGMRFQSTLPAGEATAGSRRDRDGTAISIHASRGGSDSASEKAADYISQFQSTLPAGEATLNF